MKRWYVIQTKPNQENLASSELEEQNFKTFYPTYIHQTVHPKTGTISERVLALFPSYIFIEFDFEKDKGWHCIRNTRGVFKVISFGENSATPLPYGCIEEIMLRVDASGHLPLEETIAEIIEFSPGMKVLIKSGALEGTIATYCNHSENRVVLLLTLLSRPIRLSLPIDAVGSIPPSR